MGGYVTRGTASKRRWRGRGMAGIQSRCEALPASGPGPEVGVAFEVMACAVQEEEMRRLEGNGS